MIKVSTAQAHIDIVAQRRPDSSNLFQCHAIVFIYHSNFCALTYCTAHRNTLETNYTIRYTVHLPLGRRRWELVIGFRDVPNSYTQHARQSLHTQRPRTTTSFDAFAVPAAAARRNGWRFSITNTSWIYCALLFPDLWLLHHFIQTPIFQLCRTL